jgi:outer membrane PBP1 activator LpoA protein
MAPPFARVCALWPLCVAATLGLAACAGPAPLSGSRPPPTTVPAPQPLPVPAAPLPPPPIPPAPEVAPERAPAVVNRPSTDAIVVVLPLESSLYGQAAAAVQAGFFAAAKAAAATARTRVIGYADDAVLPAFAAAADANPALIVGPLTRDDVKTVLALAPDRPRTLALNQGDDGSALPAEVYALALSVENDAALLARRARDDGVRTLASLSSDAPLQRRFKVAFSTAWEHAGGTPIRDYRFDPNPEVLGLLRRELAARPPDALLLCVGAGEAALAKSFLPPGPVYASSQVADGLSPQMLRDLEGVRYVEIPWLTDPADPALARFPRGNLGDPVLERLYALGLDAFALGDLLANPIPPDRIELDGATGHLSLLPTRSFARDGRIMIIHDGQSVLYMPSQ